MNELLTLRNAVLRLYRELKNTVTVHAKQIGTLADSLAAVNAKTQRAGATIGPLAIGSQDVTVTWDTPWPDTAYGVYIELITGAAALGNLHATLKPGSKTMADCVVTVSTAVAVATVGVDVLGIRT